MGGRDTKADGHEDREHKVEAHQLQQEGQLVSTRRLDEGEKRATLT